ncbi:MAG: hypothetical protein VXX43_09630, partial [Pseudomonadota bacterium]|nr:hypothetical protein [Pseudomonadota bacterium]
IFGAFQSAKPGIATCFKWRSEISPLSTTMGTAVGLFSGMTAPQSAQPARRFEAPAQVTEM